MKSTATKPKRTASSRIKRQSSASTKDKNIIVVRKIHNDPANFVKFAWKEDAGTHVGSIITAKQGIRLLKNKHRSACRESDIPGKKFYCYFDTEHNEPVCILVDEDDPRCG